MRRRKASRWRSVVEGSDPSRALRGSAVGLRFRTKSLIAFAALDAPSTALRHSRRFASAYFPTYGGGRLLPMPLPSFRGGGFIAHATRSAYITGVPRGAPEGAERPPISLWRDNRGDPLNLIRVMPAKGQDNPWPPQFFWRDCSGRSCSRLAPAS